MPSYTIYPDTNDWYGNSSNATYSVSREQTTATTSQSAGASIFIGQWLFSGNYRCYQSGLSFDTSGVSGTVSGTPTINIKSTGSGAVAVTVEGSEFNWSAVGNLKAGSTMSAAGSVATTVEAAFFAVPVAIAGAFSATHKFILWDQQQRLGNAPTGQQYNGFSGAETTGTTSDPYLSITTVTAVDGNASGAPASVSASAPTGSGLGGALASAALAAVLVTSLAASGLGTASVSAAPASVTVSAPAGAFSSSVTAAGAPASVTVSGLAGTATGTATAIAAPASIIVSPPVAAGLADALVAGSPASVGVSAPAGEGYGGATASGGLVSVTVSAIAGSAEVFKIIEGRYTNAIGGLASERVAFGIGGLVADRIAFAEAAGTRTAESH